MMAVVLAAPVAGEQTAPKAGEPSAPRPAGTNPASPNAGGRPAGRVAAPTQLLRIPARLSGEAADPKFTLTLNGQPARLVRVKSPKDDLLVVTVLDLTGDITLIERLRQAWTEQISVLPNNIWFAICKAQDGLQVLEDPGPDRQKAIAAVQQYGTAGKAGLLDTIESAMALGDRLQERSAARLALLYLTDSNIYNYREDYSNPVVNASDSRDLSRRFPGQLVNEKMQRLSESLGSTQTPLYFVHLQYRADAINEAYQRGMMKLAEETGGMGVFSRSATDIPEALSSIVGAMRSQWTLAAALPASKTKQISVSLVVPDHNVTFRQTFLRRK